MRTLEDPREISTRWVENLGLAEGQASGVVRVLKWLKVFDEDGKTLGFWNALRVPAFRQQVLSRLVEEPYASFLASAGTRVSRSAQRRTAGAVPAQDGAGRAWRWVSLPRP
jgi:hypothetical protein